MVKFLMHFNYQCNVKRWYLRIGVESEKSEIYTDIKEAYVCRVLSCRVFFFFFWSYSYAQYLPKIYSCTNVHNN